MTISKRWIKGIIVIGGGLLALYESRDKLEEYFNRDNEFAIENNTLNEELRSMASSGNANPSKPRFVEIMNRLAVIVEERRDLFIKLHS